MNNKFYLALIILFVGFACSSCMAPKRLSAKGAIAHYETFFINDSTLQYFIKPLAFASEKKVSIDFTFRKSGKEFSQVTMNISTLSQLKGELKQVELSQPDTAGSKVALELFFKEIKQEKFHYRYTSKIEYSTLTDFFKSAPLEVRSRDKVFLPKKTTRKKIKELHDNLFEFELKD